MLEQLVDTRDNQEVFVSETQENSCQKELLHNALVTLSQREQEILTERFNDARITVIAHKIVPDENRYNLVQNRLYLNKMKPQYDWNSNAHNNNNFIQTGFKPQKDC